MDGYKIHELRAAVLSDLHEFIPRFYYSLVRTNDDLALYDVWLAKRLLYVQRTAPQFTPRQLTAIRVLEKIGMYSCRYESPDPKSDAAEGITPESIKASCLEDLNDAITRYAKYLPEHEAKVWLVTTLAVVEQVAPDDEKSTTSNATDAPTTKDAEPPCITAGMVTITRLAITAAWEIECQSKQKAPAKKVIERLQEWVTSKRYADLIEIIPHGVKWMTTAPDEKPYDIDACRATLKAWHSSRKKAEPRPSL